ncbi:hypothetical protein BDR05DRAFT_1005980 [Suillus weaverae]|nr:hypothetical protein BDR05DRAFT_1005980 [Suillus weaverae]
MSNNLCVVLCDEQVYTSLTAHLLPDIIPFKPVWDPRDDHDCSPDDSKRPLSPCWAYTACPWFPLIPQNPTFNGPIFGCLNHSWFSLLTEVDSNGKYIVHCDIQEAWVTLEQKLLWCLEYDPNHPIPADWVLELSRSFVGDLTTSVPRMGVLVSSKYCPWEGQLPMFEKFSILVWVCFPQNASGSIDASAIDLTLHHYIPSQAAITRGQSDNKSQGALGWDVSALGWGQAGGEQPISDIPEAHTDSSFLIPQPHSGQKREEDWKKFFVRCHEENKKKEETEMPAQQQSRQSHEFGGFLEHVHLTKAEVLTSWMSYNQPTRVYDLFRNKWDLCDALDPTSVPDGDWEEDNFPPASAVAPSEPTAPPPPPPLSNSLWDIETYFGHYEVAPSAQYT